MAAYKTCVWGRRAAESSAETDGGEVSGVTTSHGVWAAAPRLDRGPPYLPSTGTKRDMA